MAWYDIFRRGRSSTESSAELKPPERSYASTNDLALSAWREVSSQIESRGQTSELMLLKSVLERAPAKSVGIPDVGFKGVRQQLFQRFNLIDLYAIAHNNSVMKTATGNLKQEVFRRGFTWKQAFDFRDSRDGTDYTLEELKRIESSDPERLQALRRHLRSPNRTQRVHFEQIMQEANVFGQSLASILHMIEDDLNVSDDGFLFISRDYYVDWSSGEGVIRGQVRQLFRMDPVFMEFDVDKENRPGFAHHVCLFHRDELLNIPEDEAESWQDQWRGSCPHDGLTTFPVMFRYTPHQGALGTVTGAQGPNSRALYLVKGEIIHVSKFSPSELYGYSPVLSIYEKVLSLIGMDRYLYDYFFERQIPQGVITTVTDNPDDLETRKEQMLAEMLNNPHYIPWMAVSSRTGQGRTEFVRFAFSLDELQFLPVQEHIERAVSALYGVPGLFMGDSEGIGGLNNESQQITRLSRGAQLSQSVYNLTLLPQLLSAFGISDWELGLETSEEYSEQFQWEMKQRKAQWASTLASIGFGVTYDEDTDEYSIHGEVQSRQEQEEAQSQMWG